MLYAGCQRLERKANVYAFAPVIPHCVGSFVRRGENDIPFHLLVVTFATNKKIK
jgi:hypothetical protein